MSDLPKVSFSQLLTWDRCRFLWKLKYIDKFEYVKKTKSLARRSLGKMGHELLFDWYKTGVDHSDVFANKWLADWASLSPNDTQNIAIATSMFKLYMSEFSPVHDRLFKTHSLEEHFEVTLKTPAGRWYILQGYIDRTSVDGRGALWVEDYKWTERFMSPLQLVMDAQLVYYAGALRAQGRYVHGTMFTQVNTYPYKDRSKKTVDELFKREAIYRSPQEIDHVMYEVGLMVDEMLETTLDLEDSPDPILRRSIRRDCASCDFQEPCSLGLKGIDPIQFLEMSPGFLLKDPPILNLEVTDETHNRGFRI